MPNDRDSSERSDELCDFIENAGPGVITAHSGSSTPSPAAFGIKLSYFDECTNCIDISSLILEPTVEQRANYTALVSTLDTEEKDLLKPFGEARVFFLTSTS